MHVNCGRLVRHGGKLAGVISAIFRSDLSYAESRIGPLFHQVRFHATTDIYTMLKFQCFESSPTRILPCAVFHIALDDVVESNMNIYVCVRLFCLVQYCVIRICIFNIFISQVLYIHGNHRRHLSQKKLLIKWLTSSRLKICQSCDVFRKYSIEASWVKLPTQICKVVRCSAKKESIS